MSISQNRVSQFEGVAFDKNVEHGGRKFRILAYQAYNAFGLIGPEMNGVAVLDDDRKVVITSNIECQPSGYFGVSEKQLGVANSLLTMPWEEFRAYVNGHGRQSEKI